VAEAARAEGNRRWWRESLCTHARLNLSSAALWLTIIVLVGVVVGGIDRLLTATLGGFTMGLAVGVLSGYLPSTGSWPFTSSVYLDSAVFMLVIVVLLLRPEGLFARGRRTAVERV
jgi:branched-subunit amino acid ABC-type transport system permease component